MSAILVYNCPRCDSKNMTFDVLASIPLERHYDWQQRHEVFCRCRNCHTSTTVVVGQKTNLKDLEARYLANHEPPTIEGSLNQYFEFEGFICIRDVGAQAPPKFVPAPIANAFTEGATSVVTNCSNAAAAMFRLAIDLATRPLLPADETAEPNRRVRRDLGLRLPWLFEHGLLPKDLEDLSHCIREDGNDGAHAGNLKREDALDLQDFATALLERLYTEPARLRLAQERRTKRRAEAER